MGQENPGADIKEQIEYPVESLGIYMSKAYEAVGLATREMHVPQSEGEFRAVRSPHTRLQRGLEYQRINFLRAINKVSRKLGQGDWVNIKYSDREKLNRLDDFDRQFQDVKEIDITTEESGHQPITYSEVKLKDKKDNEAEEREDDESLTIIIPAWSGEINGQEPLARAIAESGDTVITLNYPESHISEPTAEFAQKMKESMKADELVNFNPHTAVFKEAIKQLAKGRKVKIVGYSTGGAIAAEILNDPEFAKNVELAVLLSPVASVDQSKSSLFSGMLADFGSPAGPLPAGLVSPKELLRKMVDTGIVGRSMKPRNPEIQLRENEIRNLLIEKVCRRSDMFNTARVRDGGKIIIQTGSFDDATKARSRFAFDKSDNPQMVWMNFLQYSHISPLLNAKKLWEHVDKIADNPQPNKKYTYAFS